MLEIENTALAVIDVQGKLAGQTYEHEKVLSNIRHFIGACKAFSLPILWSEQAPDKIGGTVDAVKHLLDAMAQPIAKRSFSCLDSPAYFEHVRAINRRQILITGIETHVCVYQTARDFYRRGFEVHVVADAVSSRYQLDHELAIARMRDEGIIITTTEMALCELLKTADHPSFKAIVSFMKR